MNRLKFGVATGLILICGLLIKCSDYQGDLINNHGVSYLNLTVPEGFPQVVLSKENPQTIEGVALGKKLFFDPILSKNKNISCSSCHLQSMSFSDNRKLSVGTNGETTKFHSMPLFNMAWMNEFFWNGRAKSREEQALQPVVNPVEMDLSWPEAVARLQADSDYPFLFNLAFGTFQIDSSLVAKALVQFEMTLISSNSKYDRFKRGEQAFTLEEEYGYTIFNTEMGDCFHCHMDNGLVTDNGFHNNGLDSDADLKPGLFEVTGNPDDFGRFKTPTLRNLVFTAPYMHDGRFETIDQVIDFYSDSVQVNQTVDVLMKKAHQGGISLKPDQKAALKAFLLTMTDSTILTNPDYQDPN